MGSNLARKEAIKEYKARKPKRGVFAVRCTTGQVWVGSTPNLDAAQNSLWFCLRQGLHHSKALQAEWNTHDKDAFQYESLEKLDDDVSPIALNDLLKEKKRHWVA